MRRPAALALALSLPACTCNRSDPPSGGTAPPVASGAPAAPAPVASGVAPGPGALAAAPATGGSAPSASAPAGTAKDVHGLRVTFLEGGAIEVVGKDRWDRDFSTTYENADFLRNALPVLRRTLTDAQTDGLADLVGAGAGPKAAASAR